MNVGMFSTLCLATMGKIPPFPFTDGGMSHLRHPKILPIRTVEGEEESGILFIFSGLCASRVGADLNGHNPMSQHRFCGIRSVLLSGHFLAFSCNRLPMFAGLGWCANSPVFFFSFRSRRLFSAGRWNLEFR